MRGIDYYELLGVPRDASPSEIRSAYRSLAKAMHPDSGGTAGAFRLLHEAYETLTDPDRRDSYDSSDAPAPPRQRQQQRRARRVGDDPDHVPTLPTIDPDTIGWWQTARGTGRVTLLPLARPSREVTLAALGGWVLLLVVPILVTPPAPLLVVWLLVLAGSGAAVWRLGRRRLAADRVDQEFTTEFGTRAVFGSPGTDADQVAEQLTADLAARYLTRIPGVRIFHGLAAEVGSVFADIDHAVLCGNRLVLIESKRWLPGHYDVDDTGGLRRNGHRFRGGTIRLPDGVAAYRRIAPGLEVRGVLLLYPSRAGEITVGDQPADFPPMVPDRFVQEIGAWLAADPSTVDRQAFRAVLGQVVSPN